MFQGFDFPKLFYANLFSLLLVAQKCFGKCSVIIQCLCGCSRLSGLYFHSPDIVSICDLSHHTISGVQGFKLIHCSVILGFIIYAACWIPLGKNKYESVISVVIALNFCLQVVLPVVYKLFDGNIKQVVSDHLWYIAQTNENYIVFSLKCKSVENILVV